MCAAIVHVELAARAVAGGGRARADAAAARRARGARVARPRPAAGRVARAARAAARHARRPQARQARALHRPGTDEWARHIHRLMRDHRDVRVSSKYFVTCRTQKFLERIEHLQNSLIVNWI